MSLKSTTLAFMAALTTTGAAMAQECQTGFSINKIVFDRQENQAYAVMSNGVDEPIHVWTNAGQHMDRLGVFDLDLSLSMQDELQTLLDDMTHYGGQNIEGVDYAAPNMPRASIDSIEVMQSVANNESGSTISYPMEINLDRGNSITEFFQYNGGHSETPGDFSLDGYDIDALDLYLDSAASILEDMSGLKLSTLSMCS